MPRTRTTTKTWKNRMKQFKHIIITYDHLLGLNVDGDLDKLIDDPELAGKDQNSLKGRPRLSGSLGGGAAWQERVLCMEAPR